MRKLLAPVAAALVVLAPVSCRARSETNAPTTASSTASSDTATTPASTGGVTTTSTSSHPTAPSTTTSARPTPTSRCADTAGWDTTPKTLDTAGGAPVYLLDASRHDCFDRLAFRLNGDEAAGYAVTYTSAVPLPDGKPLTVPGGAVLSVHLLVPLTGGAHDPQGKGPQHAFATTTGSYVYPADNPAGLDVVRAVCSVGDIGPESTFAVGVTTARPFVVSTPVVSRGYRHIVIDIAH